MDFVLSKGLKKGLISYKHVSYGRSIEVDVTDEYGDFVRKTVVEFFKFTVSFGEADKFKKLELIVPYYDKFKKRIERGEEEKFFCRASFEFGEQMSSTLFVHTFIVEGSEKKFFATNSFPVVVALYYVDQDELNNNLEDIRSQCGEGVVVNEDFNIDNPLYHEEIIRIFCEKNNVKDFGNGVYIC